MNLKLGEIRRNLVKYDADLNYNWKVLIDNDNINYPHRQLLKDFDSQVFNWYNFEVAIQKQISNCFSKIGSSLSCVKQIRNASKKQELIKYSAITDTLDSIQSWRKQYNR